MEQLSAYSDWTVNPDLNPDELLAALAPVLLTPRALALALLFVSVLVPLIEELFKPIGVWLLFGRKLTPAAGFAAGAISGAGYALFESLALTLGGDSWATVVLARVGTAAVHILTSAITGWALVQAWQKRDFLRLLFAYTFGVILHGLWNGLAVVSVFASLSNLVEEPAQWLLLLQPAVYATFLVGFLALASLAGLIGFNRKLALDRRKKVAETA
jgi:RsiW-degrading membrane proteinase PrsW (M82 family)